MRSPTDDPATLVQFLDRKATGLVVPHVDTQAQAAAIVELTRYACGEDAANRLVIVQVETRKAVACIDELAQVEGVDAFLIGPNDLAYDMTREMRGARTAETERRSTTSARGSPRPAGASACRLADRRAAGVPAPRLHAAVPPGRMAGRAGARRAEGGAALNREGMPGASARRPRRSDRPGWLAQQPGFLQVALRARVDQVRRAAQRTVFAPVVSAACGRRFGEGGASPRFSARARR